MSTCMYFVADVETTGLSPKRESIVSIAASCRDAEFSTLVNPGRPIPRAASRVHGIRDADVRHAPAWGAAGFWEWVLEQARVAACDKVVLVAHNASFDASFIAAEDSRLLEPPRRPERLHVADTLALSRALLPQLRSHRQAAVFEHLFGEPPEAQHDALGDVRALARICARPEVEAALPRFVRALDLDALAGMRRATPRPAEEPALQLEAPAQPSSLKAVHCESCSQCHSTFFEHVCRGVPNT